MKKHHLFVPLVTGILLPSMIIFVLEVFVGRISPFKSAMDILRRQFAAGHNLFLLMVLAFIPFAALIVLTWVLSFKVRGARLNCIFWGGFVAVFGLTLLGHVSVWYPLYAPGLHTSSTAVIAFLFIPFYCLVALAIGSFAGWVVSLMPRFKQQASG
jgi:hypothetical protein